MFTQIVIPFKTLSQAAVTSIGDQPSGRASDVRH